MFLFCVKCFHKTLCRHPKSFSCWRYGYLVGTSKISPIENPLTLSYLKPSFISTSACLAREHTTKGWKSIARDGFNKSSEVVGPEACEEGSGAITHPVLVSKLQECCSVSSQIETFCSLVSLTPEEIERRNAFAESFNEPFRLYFPKFKIHQFGSSVNGLGFRGCDTDLCLRTTFNNEEQVKLKEVPTLKEVLEGSVSSNDVICMTPRFLLRFVRRIIRAHMPEVNEPILLIKARCPILRFYNSKYDLFCDFSCEHKFSLLNTMVLRFLCLLEPRYAVMTKIIRYWGKYGGFVGDIDMFNSYAFSLLTVFFLQSTNPPVLPSIQELTSKSDYLRSGQVDDTNMLLEDLKKFQPSKNSTGVDELLKQFFFFYLNFDFSRVIMPYTSSSMYRSDFVPDPHLEDKFESGSIHLQDPFRHSFNSTAGASYKAGVRFMGNLIHACEAYQNYSLWIPKSDNWGLCSLFCKKSPEYLVQEKWQKNRFHSIEIPYVSDMNKKLKAILEHGLLFSVADFKVSDKVKEDGSKQIVKLHCRAKHKTWQGRYQVLQECQNAGDFKPLELEHFISNELVKRGDNRTQILCEFDCECIEMSSESGKKLVLNINFVESKCPPIVAVFLKEFIPSALTSLKS